MEPEGGEGLGSRPGDGNTEQTKHETGCRSQQEEVALADHHACQEEVEGLHNLALHTHDARGVSR